MKTIKNILRIFIALWYLFGWMLHVYLGLFSPIIYKEFGNTSLLPAITQIWQGVVMPNITIFALILALFEITVGLLIINQGKKVKLGLSLSIGFNFFLILLGLGMPSTNVMNDFIMNRLPNLIFLLIQLPLFLDRYESTILEGIKGSFRKNKKLQ
jgi:hypothetical protein